MRFVPLILAALATAAIVTSCSTPTAHLDSPAIKSGWPDAGTPAPTIALQREVRYYVDERGAVWDDRGRKREAAP